MKVILLIAALITLPAFAADDAFEKATLKLGKAAKKSWLVVHRSKGTNSTLGKLGKMVSAECEVHSPDTSAATCLFEYDSRTVPGNENIIINYNHVLELEVSNLDHILGEKIYSIKESTITRRND